MIPLHRPYIGEEELEEVKKVLDSRWLTQGPKVTEFEEEVKKFLGVKYAIACSSCTTALHLALLSVGVGPGDYVMVADYTYPATGHAVMYCGASPIFFDVDPKTYNINPEKLYTLGGTKAIIPVHTFGQCADMDPIMEIAKKKGIKVIEDAACAMGSKYKDRYAGTIGDINCFSFHATKGVGIGEGGMVTTNNKELADKARMLSTFGIEPSWDRDKNDEFTLPVFKELGYNYKLSDVSAAIGLVQMKKVDKVVKRKRELAKYWDMKLEDIDGITAPYVEEYNYHNYQGYTTLVDKGIDRNTLIQTLKNKGLQTQIGTYSSCIQPIYGKKMKLITLPNSFDIYNRALRLPMYYELTEDDIDKACEILKGSI